MNSKLEEYFERHEATRPNHPVVVEAAQDESLATQNLFDLALECVKRHRGGQRLENESEIPSQIFAPSWAAVDGLNFPLLILQQRVSEETLQTAFRLLEESDPACRELAASVLRELPSLDEAPQPHSLRVIRRLEKAVAREQDPVLLGWMLSAIGWQCLPEGTSVLLSHMKSPQNIHRLVVADNLLLGCPTEQEVTKPVIAGVLSLLADEDEDVQWSMLYEIAIRPVALAPYRAVLEEDIRSKMEGYSEDLLEQAEKVFTAFANPEEASS